MALPIDITDGRGLRNEAHRELLLKKSKIMLYLAFLFAVNNLLTIRTLLTRWSVSVLKVGKAISQKY